MNDENRILSKNDIKTFILRVDLLKNDSVNLSLLAEKMSIYFDRTEKRQINNFTVNFTTGHSEVIKNDCFDFVLVSEKTNTSMTFSEVQNAFWIENNLYTNNSTYKALIGELVDIINEQLSLFQNSISWYRFKLLD